MHRTRVASWAALMLVLLLAGTAYAVHAAPATLLAQADPAEITEVGSGPLSEPTMRVSGRNQYAQDAVQLYGYLTYLVGTEPGAIYADAAPSVGTARFTYAADIAVAGSEERADTTMLTGAGTMRVYFNPAGGATWEQPASFAAGDVVAEYSIDLSQTLQRQAPGVGVLVVDAQLVQGTAAEFSLNDVSFRFGAQGIRQRLRLVGAQLAAASPPAWSAVVTGTAYVTQRDSIIVKLGQVGAASTATPAAVASACAPLDPWLSQSNRILTGASDLLAGVDVSAGVAGVDPAALAEVTSQMSALLADQRALSLPDGAADANRLVVTALSTTERGLQGMSAAIAAGDADVFAQSAAVLGDGGRLLGRAQEAVSALEAACPGA